MRRVVGYLVCLKEETVEEIQREMDYYHLKVEDGQRDPIIEIRSANETLLSEMQRSPMERIIFDPNVTPGHLYFVIGDADEPDSSGDPEGP